jgi:multisubunit Na+/H+ antiporter MnhB subunit
MATIAEVVANLQTVGIFQFFLPFIILFAILYGLLTKMKIFGDPKDDKGVNRINTIIAFACSAFIMITPTTGFAIMSMTDFLANIFAGTLIYAVTIIAFMVVLFMVATPLNKGQAPDFGKTAMIGGVVAVVLTAVLFFSSGGAEVFPGLNLGGGGGGFGSPVYFGSIDPSMIALIVVIAVMALAVFWVVK